MKLDENVVLTYKGTSGEAGDSYHWKGNENVGEGEQEIRAIVPHEKVSSNLHFIKPWDGFATSHVILSSEGSGTKVTWAIDNELTIPMKILKPMMDIQMGKSFETGLKDLKKLSE